MKTSRYRPSASLARVHCAVFSLVWVCHNDDSDYVLPGNWYSCTRAQGPEVERVPGRGGKGAKEIKMFGVGTQDSLVQALVHQ